MTTAVAAGFPQVKVLAADVTAGFPERPAAMGSVPGATMESCF
jgi:hypothetical protein